MGFYSPSGDRPELPSFSRRTRGHPIWGALGIILASLLPLLAYAAAVLTFNSPRAMQVLGFPASFYQPVPGLGIAKGIIVLTVGYMVLLYALYAVVYSLIYSALRITPYTPLDVTQPPRRVKKNKGAVLVKGGGIIGVLLSLAGSVELVRLNLHHGWIKIPASWRVPGPVPYAGVYFLVFLLLLAFFWSASALLSGLVRTWHDHAKADDNQPNYY